MIEDLTYIYQFSSGRKARLEIKRKEGQIPKFVSSLAGVEISEEEFQEYLIWEDFVKKDSIKQFSSEELLELAKYGASLYDN